MVPRFPRLRCAALAAVAVALVAAGAVVARAAVPERIRPDLLSARVSPSASAALRAAPIRSASGLMRFVPESGSLGAVASRLGLEFEPEFPAARRERLRADGESAASLLEDRLSRHWLIHLPPGLTPLQAVTQLRGLAEFESVTAVALVPVESVPDDSLWSRSYYLFQASRRDAHAPEAWDITQGDSSQIIAIIDTGVLLTHPDLAGPGPGVAGNLWTNWVEAAGQSGVDDDGDGYVDDVHGWDFISLPDTTYAVRGEDWRDEDGDPNDFVGHGTGVAGVAAAIANNRIGVAGAAPRARLMPLRVGYSAVVQPSGLVDETAAARAIVYAVRAGATVLNCSFSSLPQDDMDDALDYAYASGVVAVVAAGNNGSAHAMADRPEVISVAALDANDRLTMFTNTGAYVDLAAAGLFLCTTTLERVDGADSAARCLPAYSATASGTSFSAPLVSGAVALIQADAHARGMAPLDPASVRMRLVDTADDIAAQNPGASGYGSGRVNFLRALTDPPGSYALPLGSPAVGAAAVARSAAGPFAIVGTQAGRLLRVDGATRAVRWNVALPAAPGGSPAAADLGPTGPVPGLGVFVGVVSGQVCGFDANGQPLPGWPVAASCPAGGTASPAIADIDGDGAPDVVWGDAGGRVWAWSAGGQVLPGFPATVGSGAASVWTAVADLDGDGAAEIVAAASDGDVTVLWSDGRPLPGWSVDTRSQPAFQSPPIVARLAGDPRPAIITTQTASGSTLSVFNPDHSLRASLPLEGLIAGTAAAADVDGDGHREMLVFRATGDVLILRGDASIWESTGTSAPGTPGNLTPELVAGRGAAGQGIVQWSLGGVVASFDAVAGHLLGERLGNATPTLADLDADGKLDLVVPSGRDAVLYVYPTGAPEAGNDRMWPTARANAARTASALDTVFAGATHFPPRDVGDLRLAGVEPGAVDLAWTSPFDGRAGRAAGYDLRYSTTEITASNFAAATAVPGLQAPAAAGAPERARVSGLTPQAVYYFALVSRDSVGEPSPLSNIVRLPPADPARVTDLRPIGTTSASVRTAWTSTGNTGRDGQAGTYELRGSRSPIDASNFDQAEARALVPMPIAAGLTQTVELSGLVPESDYWIAVRSVDSLGFVSGLSNVVMARTTTVVPPVAVADLRVAARGSTALLLGWTSTGTDGHGGQAAAYDIRASRQLLDSTNFDHGEVHLRGDADLPAGSPMQASLTGLAGGTAYWIAIRALDALGFISPLSPVVTDVTMPSPVPDLRVLAAESTSARLAWTSTTGESAGGRTIAYDLRASRQVIDASNFDRAAIRQQLVPAGPGQFQTATVSGLEDGRQYWLALLATDAEGGRSDLSNVATVVTIPKIMPRAVTDLRATAASGTTLEFGWTSTGSAGRGGEAASYDVRAALEDMTERVFSLAPYQRIVAATGPRGSAQGTILSGLPRGRKFWIAVRARDSLGYAAPLSNVITALTSALAPVTPVDGVRATASGPTSCDLEWTSTGTSGTGGEPARYELRASAHAIDSTSFEQAEVLSTVVADVPAGASMRGRLDGLLPGRPYWMALRAIDAAGFASPVSNVEIATPSPLAGRGGPRLAAARSPGTAPMRLFWKVDARSQPWPARIRVLDTSGRLCRTLALPAATEGVAIWDGANDAGVRVRPGIYFVRLESHFGGASLKVALLR